MRFLQKIWWFLTGGGPWFRLKYPDVGELEGQRDYQGNLWVTARDGCYEIRLQISRADADRIAQWLLRSAHETGYLRRQLKLVDKTIQAQVSKKDSDK